MFFSISISLSIESPLHLLDPIKINQNRTAAITNNKNVVSETFKRFVFRQNFYNRYGLYQDDIREYDFCPEVKEAARRLPIDVLTERNYRLLRASQLDINKEYLPEDEWVSYEEDMTKGRYLEPYVQEVLAEWKEKLDWEKRFN